MKPVPNECPNSMLRKLFFNLRYYQKPPWDTGISPPELIEFIDEHPPGRALDLGCGTGTNAITLARSGWQVAGIDFARRAIRIARSKAKNAGLQIDFYHADVSKLTDITGLFDLILDIGCYHGLPHPAKLNYLASVDRLLGEDGSIMMYAFIRNQNEPNTGLVESEVNHLVTKYQLVRRVDGTERGQRPSAWFIFNRK